VGEGVYDRPRLDMEFEHAWGFEREVYEDPDDHYMFIGVRRYTENYLAGTLEYQTRYWGFLSYECEGWVDMRRQ